MKDIVFVFPAGCYPVPAINGGAVESLITNLINENEKQHKFNFHVIMCKHFNDKTNYDYSKYKHTKFYDFYQKDIFFKVGRLVNAVNKRLNYMFGFYSPFEKFIVQIIRKVNPQKVIFEGTFNVSVRKIKKICGKKNIVWHVHHQVIPKYKVNKHVGSILCVSDYIKRDWKESEKLPKDFEYIVLKNTLTSTSFFNKVSEKEKRELKEKYDIKEDDFVIVFCGRLVKEKGIDILIKAINRLNNKKIKLMIIGESAFKNSIVTPYVKYLKDLVNENNNIFFTGYVDNYKIHKYYSLANLQVIPSVCEEAAPVAAIEGRMMGLPQIITNSGGLPEYASDSAVMVIKEDNLQESLELEINKHFKEKPSNVDDKEKDVLSVEKYFNDFYELFK